MSVLAMMSLSQWKTEFGTVDVEITFVCCCTLALNVSVYMVLDCPDVVQDS